MKVGLVSDTHDNIPRIKAMVDVLNERQVQFVLHAGDFIAPFSLRPLVELSCDWAGVFGNNDGERAGLIEKSGGRIRQGPYYCTLDSKNFALVHALDEGFRSECEQAGIDVIVCGHTHAIQHVRDGVITVNPGEVCGWLGNTSTLALFDTATGDVEFVRF